MEFFFTKQEALLIQMKMIEEKQREEIEELYSQYYDKVYKEIYFKVNYHKEVAEDLTSQVFLKVLNNFERYDRTKASIGTWIKNITKNTVIDYYRRRKQEPLLLYDFEEEALIIDFEEEQWLKLKKQCINQVIKELKTQEKELIVLKYFQDKTNKEIAIQIGIKESTVSTRFFRLLRKIKNIIPDLEG